MQLRKRASITSGLFGTYDNSILLTPDIARTLARSIVISKLHYCNAILHGSPKSSTAVLQITQNSLARVVLNCLTVEVYKCHFTAEIIALAASSKENSV